MKIIILGNGFDLAHGLKTSYADFINYIFNSHINNKELFTEFLLAGDGIRDFDDHKSKSFAFCNFPNKLFGGFVKETIHHKWSDIEEFYFRKLLSPGYPSHVYDNEFNKIKFAFINYLRLISQECVPSMVSFKNLFSNLSNAVILNFNYTNTINKYIHNNTLCINIHGQVENEIDDIIFGYNADFEETSSLRKRNDPYLLKHIKHYNYKNSDNYDTIKRILLSKNDTHEIWILGHSCGFSDKILLKEILETPTVKVIRVLYHNDFSDLRGKIVQIENITGTSKIASKIANKKESLLIPQSSTDAEHHLAIEQFLSLKFYS